MKKVSILCDRCGTEIVGNPIKMIWTDDGGERNGDDGPAYDVCGWWKGENR